MVRLRMKNPLLPALLALALTGCVVASQITERQGTRAYLQKDYATALAKYTEAAEAGNAMAQYHLAVMYAEGEGVDKDLERAASLLQQASDQNLDEATLMLGLFHVYGDGVPADPAKGAALITRAADRGNDVAMYYLGNLYAAGLGVDRDIPQALAWMRKAKRAGFPVEDVMLTEEGLAAAYGE